MAPKVAQCRLIGLKNLIDRPLEIRVQARNGDLLDRLEGEPDQIGRLDVVLLGDIGRDSDDQAVADLADLLRRGNRDEHAPPVNLDVNPLYIP